jgi:hypothetical protein
MLYVIGIRSEAARGIAVAPTRGGAGVKLSWAF